MDGINKITQLKFETLRDTLLPKLMSGEVRVSARYAEAGNRDGAKTGGDVSE